MSNWRPSLADAHLARDLVSECYRRDRLDACGVPAGSRLTCHLGADLGTALIGLANPWAGAWTYGTFDARPHAACAGAYVAALDGVVRGVVALHLLHLSAWYPPWWEGEAVVDP